MSSIIGHIFGPSGDEIVMDFADLNEEALFAVDRKEWRLAVDLFRYSVYSLNQERSKDRRPLPPERRRHYELLPISLELDDEEPFTSSTSSQEGHFFLYDTAFLIEYDDLWYAYRYAIPTIVYNMALTLHVDGLATPDRIKLDQARQLYIKAIDFFMSTLQGRNFLEQTRLGRLRLLFLSLSNNYGHCCSLLSDNNGMRRAQALLDTLFSNPYSLRSLGKDDMIFFRMTLVIGILRDTLPTIAPTA
eukprot:scaffold5092_cov179-Amphora_coffeaeformis.AAC.5